MIYIIVSYFMVQVKCFISFRFFIHRIPRKNVREKEGDLTQSYDKTPYTNRKFENQRTTHTNATKGSKGKRENICD